MLQTKSIKTLNHSFKKKKNYHYKRMSEQIKTFPCFGVKKN